MSGNLRAPFPWFGGKSRVASLVWERFGNPAAYVEPFAGSLAVLLARPHPGRDETVNDADCYLVNFWRAVQEQPEAVLVAASSPPNEADLRARHQHLLARRVEFAERVQRDPRFSDPTVAGWWAWGVCITVGDAWHRQTPQRFALGTRLSGIPTLHNPAGTLALLRDRLARVRIMCGDWTRAVGASRLDATTTAVFLDPPYSADLHCVSYAVDQDIAADVRTWALANGDNPALRIAVCGYTGEHDDLAAVGWSAESWTTGGGYASQGEGRGRENAGRERIWFSPHCLHREQGDLLAAPEAA